MQRESLEFLFHPESVAVVGASADPNSYGYDYLKHLIDYGFPGKVYPINIRRAEVLGLKAYTTLDEVPGRVDYVIGCIALTQVPALLEACARKGTKAVHIFSALGSETGLPEGRALEGEILKKAREYGLRLLGPNCLGIYCPGAKLSFGFDFPNEAGGIGALVQSGGSAIDLVQYGALSGLRFSKVISYGNALDINEGELLEYLAADPPTRVILAFIEGLRVDGREFLELLRRAARAKPVIICKGGRSRAGARCTLSHTASLAGSSGIWDTAIRQAGGIPVRDIDDLVEMAVAFSLLAPIRGRRIGTGGAGGGRNTVSVDEWEENGFEVTALPEVIREDFRKRGSRLWYCLGNPADRSIATAFPGDAFTVPGLLMEMAKSDSYDFICANMAGDEHPHSLENYRRVMEEHVDGYIKLYKESPKPFFLIFNSRPLGIKEMDGWRWREIARLRTRLLGAGVPFFPSVDKAAKAINELIAYYRWRDEAD